MTNENEKWWLEIILAVVLVIPALFSGLDWKWMLLFWAICVLLFAGLLKVFGRGGVIESFLAACVFATLAAFAISYFY